MKKNINFIWFHNKLHDQSALQIYDLSKGRSIYTSYAQRYLIPASLTKLFVATASLMYLGNKYTFSTKILSTDYNVKRGILHGKLIFQFGGDPTLTSDQLVGMVKKLRHNHIKTIDGNVVIDTKDYTNVPYPPGELWDDLSYSFAAPVGAVNINENRYNIIMAPGKSLYSKSKYKIDIPKDVVDIHNDCLTELNNNSCSLTVYSNSSNTYWLRGCMKKNQSEQLRKLAIRDPNHFAGFLITHALTSYGITLRGRVVFCKKDYNSALVLVDHHSKQLKDMLSETLKDSNNLYANALLLALGGAYYHHAVRWPEAVHAMEDILKKAGLQFDKDQLNDGAGMSRYNLIQSRQVMTLLRYIYSQPDVLKSMKQSLAQFGHKGTLRYRLKKLHIKAYAKTGSMTSVSDLAGFVKGLNRHWYAFVMFSNNYVGKRKIFIQRENRIVAYLAGKKLKPMV